MNVYEYFEKVPSTTGAGFTIKHYQSDEETYDAMIKYVNDVVPLVADKFQEMSATQKWWTTPNALCRRKDGPDRTPEEVFEELRSIVNNSSNKHRRDYGDLHLWTVPTLCFDKYNRIIKQGFKLLGHPQLFDEFSIQWVKRVL